MERWICIFVMWWQKKKKKKKIWEFGIGDKMMTSSSSGSSISSTQSSLVLDSIPVVATAGFLFDLNDKSTTLRYPFMASCGALSVVALWTCLKKCLKEWILENGITLSDEFATTYPEMNWCLWKKGPQSGRGGTDIRAQAKFLPVFDSDTTCRTSRNRKYAYAYLN